MDFFSFLCFIGQLIFTDCQFPEPTRSVDLWDPFGTSTANSFGTDESRGNVLVRLSVGEVVGLRVTIPNLPWTPWQDPNEQIPADRTHSEPNPLPGNNNVSVLAFLGMPYAEPPIGERRFRAPQQLLHLPGPSPFLATTLPSACAQDVEAHPSLFVNDPFPYSVSEDCLHLNIFTPSVKSFSSSVSNSLPVLVFFHGGNFQTGTANDWPGHVLASRGIVVVTANYRLGSFGFMSLGDELTGNYGIKDQRMALLWVQQHIASFGGDPRAVTIAGHDAGAVSAGIHMLSPFSKNLFRGVVAMSGAEVSYHSTIGKPALAFNNTMKLGRFLGCVHPVASEVWSCILTRSTDDIVQAVSSTAVPSIPIEFNRYLFLPSVDGHELTAHPLWLLNNVRNGIANVFSVPFLVGMNAHDGTEAILEDRTLGEFTDFLQITRQYMRSFIIEYAFKHNYTMNREAIIDAIESFYTYWPDASDVWQIRRWFIDLITDAYYTQPITQSAHLHSDTGSRTFLYVNNYNFSKQRENTVAPNGEVPIFPAWAGSCHDCDLFLLFGFPFMPPELLPKAIRLVSWTDTDRNASQLFSSFVRQFTKYSDPNLPNDDGTWLAHQPRAHWYINFNYSRGQSLTVPGILSRDFRFEQVAFWENYIPALVNYMTTTFSPEEGSVRNEMVLFKGLFGVSLLVLIALLVLTLSLGYNVCTRPLRERCGRYSEWGEIQGEERGGNVEMARKRGEGAERVSSL
ncbi:hypothetical protein niasHS_002652 [Heterodera schachtii]|uniref:Carboxylesterase type B domain-containing protein n=1 Tax=Heterodera schachtii TaxID=97005 RepID=A0ABD2K229_HETSC